MFQQTSIIESFSKKWHDEQYKNSEIIQKPPEPFPEISPFFKKCIPSTVLTLVLKSEIIKWIKSERALCAVVWLLGVTNKQWHETQSHVHLIIKMVLELRRYAQLASLSLEHYSYSPNASKHMARSHQIVICSFNTQLEHVEQIKKALFF